MIIIIEIVLTSTECSTAQSYIRCHPTEDDFCISGVFRNDGIHNCPPPYSSDEPGAKQPVGQPSTQPNNAPQPSNNQQQTTITKTVTTTTSHGRSGATHIHSECSLLYFATLVAFALKMQLSF